MTNYSKLREALKYIGQQNIVPIHLREIAYLDSVRTAIQALAATPEQEEMRWIRASERLPQRDSEYGKKQFFVKIKSTKFSIGKFFPMTNGDHCFVEWSSGIKSQKLDEIEWLYEPNKNEIV